MKKTLFLIATLVMAFAANAQFEIGLGGSMSFPGKSEKIGGTENDYFLNFDVKSFAINPTIGYRINDAMSAGIYINFSQSTSRDRMVIGTAGTPTYYTQINNTTVTTFGVAPYFRYNFVSYGDIRLFVELKIAYNMGNTKGVSERDGTLNNDAINDNFDNAEGKVSALAFNVTPGVNYQVTDHISLDVFFNFVSLGYSMISSTQTKTLNMLDLSLQDIASDDQLTETYHVFGLNNSGDYLDTEVQAKYNLSPAIGVKFNVNF